MQTADGEKKAPLSGLDIFIKLSDPNSEYSANAAKALTALGKLASTSIDITPLTNALVTAASAISKFQNEIDWTVVKESFAVAQERITAIIKSVQIPTLSEERKQELVETHIAWGEYGWTLNPDDTIMALYGSKPLSQADADTRALKSCEDMTPIFDAIKKCDGVTPDDLEEAISDYSDERYKSCALIIYALIDAIFIRLQMDAGIQGNGIVVCKSAVDRAKDRVEADEKTKLLFLSLYYKNLFACLEKMFQGGRGFINQPEIINRNFLDHGMLTRKVTRTDCIQLFLLYYNVLNMLDFSFSR